MLFSLFKPDALQSLLPSPPSLSLELFLKSTLYVLISVRLLSHCSWCIFLPSIVPVLYWSPGRLPRLHKLEWVFPLCYCWNLWHWNCLSPPKMLKARIKSCSFLWLCRNYLRPGSSICLTIWDSQKIICCMFSTSGPLFSYIRVEWLRKIITGLTFISSHSHHLSTRFYNQNTKVPS